jgi:hypothetical protein
MIIESNNCYLIISLFETNNLPIVLYHLSIKIQNEKNII